AARPVRARAGGVVRHPDARSGGRAGRGSGSLHDRLGRLGPSPRKEAPAKHGSNLTVVQFDKRSSQRPAIQTRRTRTMSKKKSGVLLALALACGAVLLTATASSAKSS